MHFLKLAAVGLGIVMSIGSVLAADTPAEKAAPDYSDRILTPPARRDAAHQWRRIYGQRPGRPFLFTVPATGDRPINFSADGLPDGLKLDSQTGRITGSIDKAGEFVVTLHANNAKVPTRRN